MVVVLQGKQVLGLIQVKVELKILVEVLVLLAQSATMQQLVKMVILVLVVMVLYLLPLLVSSTYAVPCGEHSNPYYF